MPQGRSMMPNLTTERIAVVGGSLPRNTLTSRPGSATRPDDWVQSIRRTYELLQADPHPEVYMPRQASVLLAEEMLALARPGQCVLDACTGAGMVAVALRMPN